ncbi:hypothetical protein C8R47DRAFT_1212751 [Mycena vitilis]|nr:hypothetical protein C8R47DRAFT_1212751 [Mycena vitilis]
MDISTDHPTTPTDQPPPGSTSTDSSMTAAPQSPPTSSVPLKRPREEDDDGTAHKVQLRAVPTGQAMEKIAALEAENYALSEAHRLATSEIDRLQRDIHFETVSVSEWRNRSQCLAADLTRRMTHSEHPGECPYVFHQHDTGTDEPLAASPAIYNSDIVQLEADVKDLSTQLTALIDERIALEKNRDGLNARLRAATLRVARLKIERVAVQQALVQLLSGTLQMGAQVTHPPSESLSSVAKAIYEAPSQGEPSPYTYLLGDQFQLPSSGRSVSNKPMSLFQTLMKRRLKMKIEQGIDRLTA